ncbi:hypothetical protein ABW02_20570 [Niallia circulans]|uniref:Uncharacterized protein n=1 Tax=Niallia circulans TaxID=1397 RepID=A0A0J1L1L4_NIACI|nr:hypothetical protein ABW02_20570 [Niallia circulans]
MLKIKPIRNYNVMGHEILLHKGENMNIETFKFPYFKYKDRYIEYCGYQYNQYWFLIHNSKRSEVVSISNDICSSFDTAMSYLTKMYFDKK